MQPGKPTALKRWAFHLPSSVYPDAGGVMMKTLTFQTLLLFVAMVAAPLALAQTTKPTTKPARAGPAAPDQLLNSMLKPPADNGRVLTPLPDPPKIDAGTGRAIAPGPPQPNLVREGSYVVDRVGRLTKATDTQQWEVSFEADGKTMQDPPMLILPNQKLAAMEQAVSGASRDLRFRITGMVTEYKGKNYILLEKVLAIPEPTQ